jgi:hypothetical protein
MGRESLMPIDQALAIMGLTELPKSVEEYRKIRNHKLMTINAETHGELMSDTLLMISFNSASESIRHHIKNPPPPPRAPPGAGPGGGGPGRRRTIQPLRPPDVAANTGNTGIHYVEMGKRQKGAKYRAISSRHSQSEPIALAQ